MKQHKNAGVGILAPFDPVKAARHAIARDAHKQVHLALVRGDLAKAPNCEVCDEPKPLQGHHADYNYPLDVIWVCRTCHRMIHKNCGVIYVV